MAEDQAMEDTLYQLSRALYSEQLSLDRFIKHTRVISREQFMKRALAQRIVQGLGWDMSATAERSLSLSNSTEMTQATVSLPIRAHHSSFRLVSRPPMKA